MTNIALLSLVALAIFGVQVNAQEIPATCRSPVANGGCSHMCFDRGEGPVCGCPCGMKVSDSDPKLCETDGGDSCTHVIVMMTDLSSRIAPAKCAKKNQGETVEFNERFLTWKESVISIIGMFNNIKTDKTQFYGLIYDTMAQPVHEYKPEPTELLNYLKNLKAPGIKSCGEKAKPADYVSETERFINLKKDVLTQSDKTRTAVLFITGTETKTSDEIKARLEMLRKHFDHVLVFARSDPGNTHHDDQLRAIACQKDKIETGQKCKYLFFVDKENDFGAIPNEQEIKNIMNPEKCRFFSKEPTLKSCKGTMQLEVPKCLLHGYLPTDLQMIDDSCTVDYTEDGDNFLVKLPFLQCQTIRTVDVDNLKVHYSQKLVQRTSLTTSFPVELEATCETPLLDGKVSDLLHPRVNNIKSETVISDGQLSKVKLSFYKDEAHTQPIETDALPTRARIYAVAEAKFTKGASLKIEKLIVTTDTSDSSSPNYLLIDDYCPVDSTVRDLKLVSSSKATFNFQMFEFSTTQELNDGSKLSLYFHPTFKACPSASLDPKCDTSTNCIKTDRMKRSTVEETTPTKKYTIGPFFAVSESKPTFVSETRDFFTALKNKFVHVCNMEAFGLWSNLSIILLLTIGVFINNDFAAISFSSSSFCKGSPIFVRANAGEKLKEVAKAAEVMQPPPYEAEE